MYMYQHLLYVYACILAELHCGTNSHAAWHNHHFECVCNDGWTGTNCDIATQQQQRRCSRLCMLHRQSWVAI